MGVRPVDAGAPGADHDVAPASKRLADQEQVAHAAALVLVVLPGWTPRRDRHRWGDLAEELPAGLVQARSEEHTSELQSRRDLVCRLLLEKKKQRTRPNSSCQKKKKTRNI